MQQQPCCPFCSHSLTGDEWYCGACGGPLLTTRRGGGGGAADAAAHTPSSPPHDALTAASRLSFSGKSTVPFPPTRRASLSWQERSRREQQVGKRQQRPAASRPPSKRTPQERAGRRGEWKRDLTLALCCLLFASLLLMNILHDDQRNHQTNLLMSGGYTSASGQPLTHHPSPPHVPVVRSKKTLTPILPTPPTPTPTPTPVPPTTPEVPPTPAPLRPGTVLWTADTQLPSPEGIRFPDTEHWHSGAGEITCVHVCDGDIVLSSTPQTPDYALEVTVTEATDGPFCFSCGTPTFQFCIHVTDQGQQGYCASFGQVNIALDTGTDNLSVHSGAYFATWKLVFHQGSVRLLRNGDPFFQKVLTANSCPDAGYAKIHLTNQGSFTITKVRIVAA